MALPSTLILFTALLVAALVLRPLARGIHLPFALLLVLAGFAGSEILVRLGYDTGLRAQAFQDLIFHVFLPVLIFESAFKINPKALVRDLATILIVAVPVLLPSVAATAGLIFFGIGHATGFPWIAALTTGVLLAATDPASVPDQLKRMGTSQRLTVVL
jgi:CPA1 family monovalent cation:H+ antiporter